jgi:hypothetical protein
MSDYRVGVGVDQHGGTHGSPMSPLLHAPPPSGESSGSARAKPGSAHEPPAPSQPLDV